jgi:hypothetical protein
MRNKRTKKKLSLDRTDVVVLTNQSLDRVVAAEDRQGNTPACGCGSGNESLTTQVN